MQNMTRYSVKSIWFVKGYRSLSFANNTGENIGKNKNTVNTVKNFLIMLNNLLQMHSKLLQKESLKKQRKQPEI